MTDRRQDTMPSGQPIDARALDRLRTEVHQLHLALESRTTTARATGVLASRLDLSTDQAWSLLCETSHLSNRKVIEIARIIVDTHDNLRTAEAGDLRAAAALAPVLDLAIARVNARRTG